MFIMAIFPKRFFVGMQPFQKYYRLTDRKRKRAGRAFKTQKGPATSKVTLAAKVFAEEGYRMRLGGRAMAFFISDK
ncbi:hypothetical protein HUU05_23360 [candidate division KSB1 bacterium]|nr:hypothetical protein [candidate division KSB1 bacterium]